MSNNNRIVPFYEKNNFKTFVEEDEYYVSLLPGGLKSWFSDEIGMFFFKNSDSFITNNIKIQIYNESRNITLNKPSSNNTDNKATTKTPEDEIEGRTIKPIYTNTPKSTNQIKYKIFISDDGAKLTYLANTPDKGLPNDNEILVFIEGDSEISSRKLIIRVGRGVKMDNTFIKDMLQGSTNVNQEVIDDLLKTITDEKSDILEALFVVRKMTKYFLKISANITFKIFDKISHELEKHKIKKEIWSPAKNKDQFNFLDTIEESKRQLALSKTTLNEIKTDFLEKLKKHKVALYNPIASMHGFLLDIVYGLENILVYAAEFMATAVNVFASVFAGFINGVIDMIVGLLWMIETAIKINLGLAVFVAGTNTKMESLERDLFLEQIENFIDAALNINFTEVLTDWYQQAISFVNMINFSKVAIYIKEKTTEKAKNSITRIKQEASLNKVFENMFDVAYYFGYMLTFFIPCGAFLEALGKFGGVGGRAVVLFFEVIEAIIGKAFKIASNISKKSISYIRALIRAFTNKLKESKEVGKLAKDFIDEVIKWLDYNIIGWRELVSIFTAFGLMSFTVIDANALYSLLVAGGFTAGATLLKKLLKYSSIQFGEAVTKTGKKLYTILYKDIPIFTGLVDDLDKFLQKLGKQKDIEKYLDELTELAKNVKDWPKIKNKFPIEKIPKTGYVFEHLLDINGTFRDLSGKIISDVKDFVITKNGKFIIGNKHHFLGLADEVLAAGQVVFYKGKIIKIDNLSGHYRPTIEQAMKYIELFSKIKLPVRNAEFNIYNFIEDGMGYVNGVLVNKLILK